MRRKTTAKEYALTLLDDWPDWSSYHEWARTCEFHCDECCGRAARRKNFRTARFFEAVRLWVIRIANSDD